MKRESLQKLNDSDRTTDADLVKRVSEGDLSPLGVLYDRHHEGVRQFISRATSGGAETDDLAHETFLTFAKIASKFDGRTSARPFLLGIAAQLMRRRRRGIQRWTQALASFATTFTESRSHTPEDAASVSQEVHRFEDALRRLSEEKRLTFLLVEREGLSGEEVAQALDIPVNTVWTRLHHARSELRRAMSPATEA